MKDNKRILRRILSFAIVVVAVPVTGAQDWPDRLTGVEDTAFNPAPENESKLSLINLEDWRRAVLLTPIEAGE